MDVAERPHGIWTHGHAPFWSGVRGASLAPKSTWWFVIALIPAPEPTALYEIDEAL